MNKLQEIREYREREGCSLQEAGNAIQKRYLLKSIQAATTLEELKDLLKFIVERLIK